MIDKEQILSKHIDSNLYRLVQVETELNAAMDEYAKAFSIAFAEWVNGEYVAVVDNEWRKVADNVEELLPEKYTISELYELYLQSIKQ